MADAVQNRTRIAVFISGSGTNMAALIYASRMEGAGYQVVLVASNDPKAAGLALAAAEGIATFVHSHRGMERAAHDAVMEAAAIEAGVEMIILAGYMRILSPEFVARWEGRLLNIHPSLLPKYRGLDTYQRALDAGDSKSGASVHLVSPELDAGHILGQLEVTILPGDTAGSLAARILLAEHQLYPRVVDEYVQRPYDAGHLLGRVRSMAMALPEVEERESHGSPGWRCGGKSGKYFAHFINQHHGEAHIALLAKTSGQDELADLIARDPGTFYRPAYYGASGWAGIILNRPGVDWDQVEYWLTRSWHSTAPRRLTALMDAADEF